MNFEEKLRILKHITLGTNEVLYYPYNFGTEPLPLRPLSSFELDESFYKSLEYAEPKIVGFLIKYRAGFIKGDTKIDLSEIPNEKFIYLKKALDTTNYWIVYHAMKDFQDPEFKKPDYDELDALPKGFYIVKKMQEVHEIAEFVLAASTQDEDVIKEIVEDSLGREIAYITYYLKVPLADTSKLTDLQRNYLVYTKGKLSKWSEEDLKNLSYSKSGDEMTLGELLNSLK